jgi:hypothetical protein
VRPELNASALEVNDLVKYSRPQNAEEEKLRFHVLEIHRDVENPRAHIQLVCDWRIKPVEVVALADIESAASWRNLALDAGKFPCVF